MDGGAGKIVVHPAIEPLSYLIGTWRGQGEGGFPTISSFAYGEELNFTLFAHSSIYGWYGYRIYLRNFPLNHPAYEKKFMCTREKPVIAYSQKTWKLNSGEPMHAESGYWRPKPDGTIEVVIAQSTGLVEIQKGTYDAEKKVVKLQSELVGNASKVKEITRVFTLVKEELHYVVEMATDLTDLQPHLKASLKKI